MGKKLFVFDLDGVLIDSKQNVCLAYRKAFIDSGINLTDFNFEALFEKHLWHNNWRDGLPAIMREIGYPHLKETSAELVNQRKSVYYDGICPGNPIQPMLTLIRCLKEGMRFCKPYTNEALAIQDILTEEPFHRHAFMLHTAGGIRGLNRKMDWLDSYSFNCYEIFNIIRHEVNKKEEAYWRELAWLFPNHEIIAFDDDQQVVEAAKGGADIRVIRVS